MEKKYYFRGLGLGIVMTAIIMGIALSGGKKNKMTDDEVIARAKELGMIEDSRLLAPEAEDTDDGQPEEDAAESVKETPEASNKEAAKSDLEPAAQDEASAEQKDGAVKAGDESGTQQAGDDAAKADTGEAAVQEETPAETKENVVKADKGAETQKPKKDTNEMTKQDEDVEKPETKTRSVTIVTGDGSYTVAKKLMEAGAVLSAESFDDFLCQKGYDKKLRTGTFQIPANASDEQIAKIVTGQGQE